MVESGEALNPGRALRNLAAGFSILDGGTLVGIFLGGIVAGAAAVLGADRFVIGMLTASGTTAGILLARVFSPERKRQRALEHVRQAMTIRRQLVADGVGTSTLREVDEMLEVGLRETCGADASALRERIKESDRTKVIQTRTARIAAEAEAQSKPVPALAKAPRAIDGNS